jgi:hypothetical protein
MFVRERTGSRWQVFRQPFVQVSASCSSIVRPTEELNEHEERRAQADSGSQ